MSFRSFDSSTAGGVNFREFLFLLLNKPTSSIEMPMINGPYVKNVKLFVFRVSIRNATVMTVPTTIRIIPRRINMVD